MSTERRPEWMVNDTRVREIRKAIEGRLMEHEKVPEFWAEEYNRRLEDSKREAAKRNEEKICTACQCRTCRKNETALCEGCEGCMRTGETKATEHCDRHEAQAVLTT